MGKLQLAKTVSLKSATDTSVTIQFPVQHIPLFFENMDIYGGPYARIMN